MVRNPGSQGSPVSQRSTVQHSGSRASCNKVHWGLGLGNGFYGLDKVESEPGFVFNITHHWICGMMILRLEINISDPDLTSNE